ncbi:MAG: extracellular solute-binding protein [Proteobacteria bacterium]|nr:extracellular solute-binding protein [Pseudomonadota bacterium]
MLSRLLRSVSMPLVTSLLVISGTPALAVDKLVIISPHRKSIQNEYLPSFKAWYKQKFATDVDVDWIDQGGTNDDVKFIKSKFAANKASAGIDVFWGGGSTAHTEISDAGQTAKLNLNPGLAKEIPSLVSGMPLMNKSGTFIAQALSSFGIFYNRPLLKLEKIAEPSTWSDLGDVKFKDKIVLCDPRKSGTYSVLNHIILESEGWEKGSELLFRMAGNARQFTQSSSDPIKAIVAGDASATVAIDFYAVAKIGDLGAEKLGFVLPEGKTIIEGDPVSILLGAPNRKVADRFVDYILSKEGQLLLMLPKGTPGGPKTETLGRLAVNTVAYQLSEGTRINKLNPLTAKGFLKYDADKASKVRKVFDDMLGASMIDTHKELRMAWNRVVAKGLKPADVAAFTKFPITHDEMEKLAAKWDNGVFRNEEINKWVKFSREKFESVAK